MRSQLSISLQNHSYRVLEVLARLRECAALGICPGQFFRVGNIPAPVLLDHGCKFSFHVPIIPCLITRLRRLAMENPEKVNSFALEWNISVLFLGVGVSLGFESAEGGDHFRARL